MELNTYFIDQHQGRNTVFTDQQIVDFLHTHLEAFGDPKEDIQRCLDYVHERGGFICLGLLDQRIVGAVVINETGMSKYIPENILVYIAMDKAHRGKGFGRQLMQAAIERCQGDIALHVEPDNPAKFLYEKLGCTNKYLEMRLKQA